MSGHSGSQAHIQVALQAEKGGYQDEQFSNGLKYLPFLKGLSVQSPLIGSGKKPKFVVTSTVPRIMPAPMVPIPAKKNGIETWNRIEVHFSCLMPGRFRASFSSLLPGSPAIFVLFGTTGVLGSSSSFGFESCLPNLPVLLFSLVSLLPFPVPALPPLTPGSGSEDAIDVVMMEVNDPVEECGSLPVPALSLLPSLYPPELTITPTGDNFSLSTSIHCKHTQNSHTRTRRKERIQEKRPVNK